MSAPNRSDVVKRTVIGLANFTRVSKAELEDRRRRFLPHIIENMPPEDAGNWGVLLKTDKNPDFIPVDIIVWKPTMEHIDVTTADDMPDGSMIIVPIWKNHGVIGKTDGTKHKVGLWKWLDVNVSGIPRLTRVDPPAPPLPPVEPPREDPDDLFERMLIQGVERIADGVENMAAMWGVIAKRLEKM